MEVMTDTAFRTALTIEKESKKSGWNRAQVFTHPGWPMPPEVLFYASTMPTKPQK